MAKIVKKKKTGEKTSSGKGTKVTAANSAAPQDHAKSNNLKSTVGLPAKSAVRQVTAEVVDENEESQEEFRPDQEPSEDIEIAAEPEKALVPVSTKSLTTSDPLHVYLNEIRKYNVMTREQEQEVARRYYDNKDPQAAQELIKSNLRFVVKVAAEYSKFGAKMIDLIQEGNVGLMHAVKEYNPYKGVRLITYAVWWIRGYIQEYLMKQFSMVKIGTTPNQRKLFYQLQKQKEELERMGLVGVEAISEKLGIPVEEITSMQNRLTFRDVSLDKPINEDGSVTLQDVQSSRNDVPVDEQIAHAEMIELLKEKIEEIRPLLNEKEKIILEERLLNDEPLTLQEIGTKYKITREAVRQAEVRLMKKIKDRMGLDS